MEWHRYSGYALFGVLLFRLYWGVVGSSTARFAQFVRSPLVALHYLRNKSGLAFVGHNPLGAWSVLALLGLLLAQVTLGLFTVDVDGIESGPLSYLVSFDTGRTLAHWHHKVFDILLAFVVLHLAAVVFYLIFKRSNLIGPMISGWKKLDTASVQAVAIAPWWRAAIGIAIAAAIVWFVASR